MDGHNAKPKRRKERINKCLWAMWLPLLLIIVGIICVGAVVATRLQWQVDKLEQEMHRQRDGDQAVRVKRNLLCNEQTGNQHQPYHVIPSRNIAFIYAHPDNIPVANKSAEPEELQFKESKLNVGSVDCGKLYRRGDGQMLCTANRKNTPRPGTLYMTSAYQYNYDYFTKAGWMDENETAQNYVLLPGGKISIRESGIYIVYASISFTDVNAKNTPYYHVYKTARGGADQQLISKCGVGYAETSLIDKPAVFPCQAWQLSHLQGGEQVYLSIGPYSWFLVASEKFYLSLIRLDSQ